MSKIKKDREKEQYCTAWDQNIKTETFTVINTV